MIDQNHDVNVLYQRWTKVELFWMNEEIKGVHFNYDLWKAIKKFSIKRGEYDSNRLFNAIFPWN